MRKTHHCTNKNTRTYVALLPCTCVAALAEIPACEARLQSSPARRGCSFEWSPAMSVTSQRREKHDASSAYYIHSPSWSSSCFCCCCCCGCPFCCCCCCGGGCRVYAPHFHPDPNPEGQTWVYGPARLSSIWVIFSPGPSLQGPSQGDNLGGYSTSWVLTSFSYRIWTTPGSWRDRAIILNMTVTMGHSGFWKRRGPMARVNQPCLRVRLSLGVVELQASCFTQKLEHYAWNLNESRPQTNHASDIFGESWWVSLTAIAVS